MKKQGVRARVIAWMIGKSVPILNLFRKSKEFPYTLNKVREFPPKSLGAETAAFLDKRNFEFLPQFETHDIVHTLLGYGTTTTGELRLQAFMWGNKSASFPGKVLLILGMICMPELWSQFRKDFERGRKSKKIEKINLLDLLDQDIESVRLDLGTSI